MRTNFEKNIEKPFSIAPVQFYEDNKKLITVQSVMGSGADCLPASHGIIVGAHDGMPIYVDVETHGNVIGNTGSGKTASAATSNLLSYMGSVVSLEIGGATLKRTYNYRKHALKQNIYVFDPHNIIGLGSSNYNPMDDLDPTEPDFYSRILTMASALISDSAGHKEQNPYFRENPSGLIAAMIVYLKLADSSLISDEQRNFLYLAQIFSKFPSEAWNKHIKALEEWRGPHDGLLNKFGNYLSTAQPGDQNVRSVVTATSQWLDKWMADTALGQHIVSSDFSMMDLRDKKTTLYIVMPNVDAYINYQPWLRLILQSAIDSTPNPGDGGKDFKQEDRILFMIDELTQLGHLQVVATGAQTVRQKGIIFWSLFQDYGSLIDVYGEERASAFLGSSEVIQFLRSNEDRSLEYISKHLGRYMVYVPTVSEAQGTQIGIGQQQSVANGTANQKTWQSAESNSSGRTAQKTTSLLTTTGTFRSSTGGGSNTEGSSEATSTGVADAKGDSSQTSKTESEGGGTVISKTTQNGLNNNENRSTNYALSHQTIIIEGLDFREIKERLAGERQILFTNGKEGSHCTLDDQARYYEIPFLKERAEGPPVPKVPAFPDPPEKMVVKLTPMPSVDLEDFGLDESKLNWKPENLVEWKPPADLSEWGQGVKDAREAYDAARYRLDRAEERPSFFQSFFRSPVVRVGTAVGVATTCYIGGGIAAAGITFGALMLTGMVSSSWQRRKVEREKRARWKDYTDMRGTAMKMVGDQLAPVMAAHEANYSHRDEMIKRQRELVAGNEKMEATLADRHVLLKTLLEEHRANLATCRQAFKEIRSGFVSGWSSGDWILYVQKLRSYHRIRNNFFDFYKGDYLPAPELVTPAKLGAPPPRTLFSDTAPMPETFKADPLAPEVSQELSVPSEKGMETLAPLQTYLDAPLVGYDLPDDIKTVGDAVTRRAELAGSKKRRDRKDVMLVDAALESVEDPLLEKFDGLVRGYVTGLRCDEDAYTQLLRQQIREGQQHAMNTIKKIRHFNGQVMRLKDAQDSFVCFAERLDEVCARAHHRAHARAIKDMESMERIFEEQSDMLEKRGPLVPPKQPRKRPELRTVQPPK